MPNNTLSHERCMELLNSIVEYECVARSYNEAIYTLLTIGFTTDELIHQFNFSADDVNAVNEEWEEEYVNANS